MKTTFGRAWFGALLVSGTFFGSSACVGSTGSDIVSFPAFASGPADATGGPLTFTNGRGWRIRLDRARVHMGGVYLNRSVPVSGGQERSCFLPGVYVAEVIGGLDVDALSPSPQPFPTRGNGTADHAVTGEVWLTGGRVDALDDRTVIADVAGEASRDGTSVRFEGRVTIGRNRAAPSTDPARPGSKPLCGERIVTPIPTSITPSGEGALLVRVEPRAWFANVELGELPRVSPDSELARFVDASNADQPSENLYAGLRSSGGVYTFEWMP